MLGKKVVKLTPTAPLYPTDVIDWLAEFKMKIIAKTGVRVLHDYLKERQLCDDKFALLLQAEQQYCHQEPYARPLMPSCEKNGKKRPAGICSILPLSSRTLIVVLGTR
jgi:hypothetical protein